MIKQLIAGLALCLASISAFASDERVNINSADAATIASEISGIGVVKAEAIVKYREQHGDYTSVDDLANVKGIGDKTVDKIRAQVSVSSADADSR